MDRTSLRHMAARQAYRLHKRGKRPPSGKHATWLDWWTERFGDGQTFEEYLIEAQARR